MTTVEFCRINVVLFEVKRTPWSKQLMTFENGRVKDACTIRIVARNPGVLSDEMIDNVAESLYNTAKRNNWLYSEEDVGDIHNFAVTFDALPDAYSIHPEYIVFRGLGENLIKDTAKKFPVLMLGYEVVRIAEDA